MVELERGKVWQSSKRYDPCFPGTPHANQRGEKKIKGMAFQGKENRVTAKGKTPGLRKRNIRTIGRVKKKEPRGGKKIYAHPVWSREKKGPRSSRKPVLEERKNHRKKKKGGRRGWGEKNRTTAAGSFYAKKKGGRWAEEERGEG